MSSPRCPAVPARLAGPAAAFLLTVALALPAASQYEERLVNDEITGEEGRIDPVAVRLADGGYAAFWADNSRGHTDVLGRRYDDAFVPVAPPFRVNTDEGLFAHREIEVGRIGGGVFALVWQDDRHGKAERAIYGRIFDAATAEARTADFRVDGTLGFGVDQNPRLHTSPSGETLVVWIGQVNQRPRVIGRRMSPDGSLGADFLAVPENPTHPQFRPAVTRLPDGRWFLAWSEEDEVRDRNVFFRFLAADGTPEGAPVRANSDLFFQVLQTDPDAAVIGNRILLVWNDTREGTSDVWGRWVRFDGTLDGEDASLRTEGDPAADDRPRIHLGGDGSYALSWFGGIEDRQRAMVHYYDAAGTLAVDARRVNDPGSDVTQRQASLVPAGDGSWWELWSDDRLDPDSPGAPELYWGSFAQRFDPESGLLGTPIPLVTNPASASQLYPDVALFPDGRAVVAWADFREGSLAIYARLLDATGRPEGPSFRVGSVPVNVDLTTIDAHDTVADFAPRVAAGASGFVVTWAINELGERLNYWAQYYDTAGNEIGENFVIAPGDEDLPQRDARPVMLPAGGFAIVYQMASVRGDGSDSDIFLQRYGPEGLPILPRIVVPTGAVSADQVSPSVAVSTDGVILVSWLDRRAGGWDVMSQRFSSSGDRLGVNVNEHAPDEPTSDQVNASVAVGPDRTLAVWETRPLTGGRIDGRLEIFATRPAETGGAGETRGGDDRGGSVEVTFQVNPGREARGAKNPEVTMAPDGRFLVTWWENAAGQTRLLAQRFDASGLVIGGPYPVNGNGDEGSRLPARLDCDDERIQFVWGDTRRGKGWDVRARRVDWEFAGAPTPVLLRLAEAYAGPEGVEVLWQTESEIDFLGFHLHRQPAGWEPSREPGPRSVRLTAALLEPDAASLYRYLDTQAPRGEPLEYFLEAVDRDGGREFFGPIPALAPITEFPTAWPNPFATSVTFGLPGAGTGALEVFDAAGRHIRTLTAAAASGQFVWDGRDERGDEVPTGIYFARPSSGGESTRVIRLR